MVLPELLAFAHSWTSKAYNKQQEILLLLLMIIYVIIL